MICKVNGRDFLYWRKEEYIVRCLIETSCNGWRKELDVTEIVRKYLSEKEASEAMGVMKLLNKNFY